VEPVIKKLTKAEFIRQREKRIKKLMYDGKHAQKNSLVSIQEDFMESKNISLHGNSTDEELGPTVFKKLDE